MADIHDLFQEFNNTITLTSAKTENLRTSRNALRQTIKDWFSEKEKKQPKFCWQGSFAMKTTVNPTSGNDYDIDDGVYLSGYSGQDISDWPTPGTVHNWIKTAVTGHVKESPINKDTCIRVPYASGYHVDLPIYIEKDKIIYLAHKTKGWMVSDPRAFRDWFVQKVKDNDEQLRRLVKYLKAWKEYNELPLKGIELTILATDNFCIYEGHDEKSLRDTVQSIIDNLSEKFVCTKPVVPNENLFDGISETKKSNILDGFKDLKSALDSAIAEKDPLIASNTMIDIFGDRFPKGTPLEESKAYVSYTRTDAPGVLKHNGRSA